MFRFYALLTYEESGEIDVLKFSDNYEFACAACSAGEIGAFLEKTTRAELSKDQIENAIYFETDQEFRGYYNLD